MVLIDCTAFSLVNICVNSEAVLHAAPNNQYNLEKSVKKNRAATS